MEIDIVNLISSLGFPIAVAIWAMWTSRRDKEWLQNTLSTQISSLVNAITEMTKALDEMKDLVERSK